MIAGNPHQLSFRVQTFKEESELELKEDHRVDGRSPVDGVAVLDPVAHEGENEGALQVSIEVISRNQLFQRDLDRPLEVSLLGRNEHGGRRLSRWKGPPVYA